MNKHKLNDSDRGSASHSWIQVAETTGTSETQMTLEYLHANGIPATALESRGIAMITGRHSIARVMVPEKEVGPALLLLDPEVDLDESEFPLEHTEAASDLDKALLGTTALVMSPVGAGIAYALSLAIGSDEDESESNLIVCPKCDVGLELSENEVEQRAFTCPDCLEDIDLDTYVACPWCEVDLEFEAEEISQGWFICPQCRRAARL